MTSKLRLAASTALAAIVLNTAAVVAAKSDKMHRLQAPDLRGGESLGIYPTTSGKWIVAGIISADEVAGSVAVFSKNNGVWTHTQRLMAPVPQVGDGFGTHTAIAGDLLVVSAYGATTAFGAGVGEAHVYRLRNNLWVHEATLASPDPIPQGGFGHYVEIQNDRILVGEAIGHSTGGWAKNRAVYEFRQIAGVWSLSATISTPADLAVPPVALATAEKVKATRNSGFGNHFDADGATLAVGSMGANAVVVYARRGNSWVYDATLRGVAEEDGLFGRALALENDLMVIGEPGAKGSTKASGLAHVYRKVRGRWTLETSIGAPDARAGDMFGHWVDIDNGMILVGAYRYTGAAAARSGAGFLYRRINGQWSLQRALAPTPKTAGQSVAYSVDIAGGTAVLSSGDELGVWTKQNPLKPGGIWVTDVR